MRTSVAGKDAGTPASETVTPRVLFERTSNPAGVGGGAPGVRLGAGEIRIVPLKRFVEVPDVTNRIAACFGIEYGNADPVWPLFSVTACGWPAAVSFPGEKNWKLPVSALSPGFTRMTCVVHPPPSTE